MSHANQQLFEILTLSGSMLEVARRGTEDQHDAECGIVFATLHDYALHMRKLATGELNRHFANGWYDDHDKQSARSVGLDL